MSNEQLIIKNNRKYKQIHVELKAEVGYLHEKIGKEALVDASRSQWRGQMLQSSRLQPPRHNGITGIAGGTRIVQGPAAAGVIVKRRRCSIALLHLATHVALRSPLRSQFLRSDYQRYHKKQKYQIPK